MSDIIFYKNGEETFRISPPTVGTKCPETKLEVKKMTDPDIIKECRQTGRTRTTTKNLLQKAYHEQMTKEIDISTVLIEGDTATIMGVKYKRVEEPKTPAEEAYKRWWGDYPPTTPSVSNFDDNMWSAFQKGYTSAKEDYEVGEYQPTSQEPDEPTKPMNEVLDRLENKYENDDVVNRILKKWEENPPDFLKFELGRSLEALITRWWDDVYDGIHQDWDREVAIDDLIDQIQLWLPKSQSSSGTQSASVIDLVDGYNDALTKIKSKLRNKK